MSATPENSSGFRVVPVALSLVLGASLLGYLVGMRPPELPLDPPVKGTTVVSDAVLAMEYSDHPRTVMSPNREWRTVLAPKSPSMLSGLPLATPEEKRAAIRARGQRRAYDGAPPTIPHAVDELSTSECLVCHEQGLALESARAPAMSHDTRVMCTQCHVQALSDEHSFAASGFEGRESPGPGERCGPGAPPVIPHTTWMRENCNSCHGDPTSALRTSHPERVNCRQCHAADADRDQLPMLSPTAGTFPGSDSWPR